MTDVCFVNCGESDVTPYWHSFEMGGVILERLPIDNDSCTPIFGISGLSTFLVVGRRAGSEFLGCKELLLA